MIDFIKHILLNISLVKKYNKENFMNEKYKIGKYYKFYTELDKEIKTKTRLYMISKNDQHVHFKWEKEKIIKYINIYKNSNVVSMDKNEIILKYNAENHPQRKENTKLNNKIKKK